MTFSEQDFNVLADTIYGEARGEFSRMNGGLPSLIAVANVVVNRLKIQRHFGRTLSEVCLKPKQFSCWLAGDPNFLELQNPQRLKSPLWKLCLSVAKSVAEGHWPDLTKGSTHYYAEWSSPPFWARGTPPQLQIGQHIFFSLKG